MAMGGMRFVRAIAAAAIVAPAVGMGACGGGGTTSNADGGSEPNLKQRPNPSAPLFDEGMVHQLSLEMSADDWQSILGDTRGDEWRHAKMTYDGVAVEEVGVRPSGESSRLPGNPKMSMRIKFDAFDGQGMFGGYHAVSVKGPYDDGSLMRERLSLFVFGSLTRAPKAAHVRVVVNGDLRGVFTLREIWDETSIAEHFTQPLGPLYRVRPPAGVDPYVNLGPNPSSYVPTPWERHIKDAARGDEVVPAFLQGISDPAALETYVDLESIYEYLVAATITMTTDGLVGSSGIDDHYQYFDPQSGKFFVLPWDPDNTFGSQGETPEKLIYSKLGRNVLTMIVRDRSELRAQYKIKIAEGLAALPLSTLQAKADAIYNQIKDAVYEDPNKMYDNGTFDWSLTAIKDFAAARYANLQMQLQ
jgi:spore coat protein CotH